MKTDERGYFDALAERVLGAVFEESNTLGAGSPKKVYQRAPLHELLVEEVLVIEWKYAGRLSNEPTAQRLDYLRNSGRSPCPLVRSESSTDSDSRVD